MRFLAVCGYTPGRRGSHENSFDENGRSLIQRVDDEDEDEDDDAMSQRGAGAHAMMIGPPSLESIPSVDQAVEPLGDSVPTAEPRRCTSWKTEEPSLERLEKHMLRALEKLEKLDQRMLKLESASAVRGHPAASSGSGDVSDKPDDAAVLSRLEEVIQDAITPSGKRGSLQRGNGRQWGSIVALRKVEHAQPGRCERATNHLLELAKSIWRLLPLFSPAGGTTQWWHGGMLLAFAYTALVIPLQAGFPELFSPLSSWDVVNYLLDVVFLADIYVKLRTCFVVDGMLVTDPAQIAARYRHGKLYADLVVALPISCIVAALNGDLGAWYRGISPVPASSHDEGIHGAPVMRMLLVVRPLLRLLRLSTSHDTSFALNPALQRLVPLLLLLVCSCHWTGCLYWGVVALNRQADAPRNWLPDDWLLTQPASTRYAYAFVWGISMISGYVPFEVHPTSALESVITALVMLVAVFINTVIISSTTTALQSM